MRADEITKLIEASEDGTFAGVRFDDISVLALKNFSDASTQLLPSVNV